MSNNSKKIIFSADDFAKCDEMDYAILKGFESGVLTSTCIMANGANYEKAVNEIIPQFPNDFKNGGLGCHLNIIEGKSLLEKNSDSMLCDGEGNYNKGFIYMLINSFSKKFMDEVEKEFRSQIEKVLNDPKIGIERIDHINSHVHTHGIPKIFELTCKLAQEYGINTVRTQREPFYKCSFVKYKQMGLVNTVANVIKNVLLNLFNLANKYSVKKYGLKTNDKFIGLLFTGFMDEEVILNGLDSLKNEDFVTEVLIHPYLYSQYDEIDVFKEKEYLLTQNENFRPQIVKKGFELVNFCDIS